MDPYRESSFVGPWVRVGEDYGLILVPKSKCCEGHAAHRFTFGTSAGDVTYMGWLVNYKNMQTEDVAYLALNESKTHIDTVPARVSDISELTAILGVHLNGIYGPGFFHRVGKLIQKAKGRFRKR